MIQTGKMFTEKIDMSVTSGTELHMGGRRWKHQEEELLAENMIWKPLSNVAPWVIGFYGK
jgi:hypothetical protein